MLLELNLKPKLKNSLENFSKLKDLRDKHLIMLSKENKTMLRLKEN